MKLVSGGRVFSRWGLKDSFSGSFVCRDAWCMCFMVMLIQDIRWKSNHPQANLKMFMVFFLLNKNRYKTSVVICSAFHMFSSSRPALKWALNFRNHASNIFSSCLPCPNINQILIREVQCIRTRCLSLGDDGFNQDISGGLLKLEDDFLLALLLALLHEL